MEIYEYINYDSGLDYIISQYIREYDISKANINILYKYNILNKDKYEYFLKCPREERQISIGLMIKDNKNINNILKKGICRAREDFIKSNNIKENEILSINNDAIFLINKIPEYTKFDNIEFKNKHTYTSFYKINKTKLYYFYDKINNVEILDVKGIDKNKLVLHENYLLDFLKVCFDSAQSEHINETLDLIITFYNNYLNLNLDLGYYREFNTLSDFKIKSDISGINVIRAQFLEEFNKKDIDIGYNLNFIRTLFQYYSIIQQGKN